MQQIRIFDINKDDLLHHLESMEHFYIMEQGHQPVQQVFQLVLPIVLPHGPGMILVPVIVCSM